MKTEHNVQNKHGRIYPNLDSWMVEQSLRQPKVEIFDFTKSKEDKQQLSDVKASQNKIWESHQITSRFKTGNTIGNKARLIIHVNNIEHKLDFKTTISVDVYLNEVSDILSHHNVIKAYYNGKKL